MKKKIVWVIVSCLMVLSLVMASCGPATEEEEEEVEELRPTTEPKHGGRITTNGGDFRAIDPTQGQAIGVGHMQMTSSELLQGDWTKGPQGSGKTAWDWGFLGQVDLEAGELAESWELPDNETIIFNLHQGVKYQNRPPANGRELIADDVVWNIYMQYNYPKAWQTIAYHPDEPAQVTDRLLPGDPRRPTSVTALDKYTVEIKVPAASQALMFLEIGDNLYTNPPECWTEGDGWQDYSEVVGSGPWILDDYVSASYIVYKKHPDYFEYDPNHSTEKLPYLDEVKLLIISDASTRIAALRTGELDYLEAVAWEDALQLMDQVPDLEWNRKLTPGNFAAGRMDKPELPFDDIRVRQAMNLAVNQQEILDGYYAGEGVLLGYPFPPTKGFEAFYTPLEDMPEEVQELFTYDPEKARQLLADAGYPEGFKTSIYCTQTSVDFLSLLKNYLDAVNVDMEIKPMETGQWFNLRSTKGYEEMFYGPAAGVWAPHEQLMTKTGMVENIACIDDPYFAEVGTIIARDMVNDPDNYVKTMKEAAQYELSLAWGIFTPAFYTYQMWWPWFQNYHGVTWAGWANMQDLRKFYWIDTEMKESMGH